MMNHNNRVFRNPSLRLGCGFFLQNTEVFTKVEAEHPAKAESEAFGIIIQSLDVAMEIACVNHHAAIEAPTFLGMALLRREECR